MGHIMREASEFIAGAIFAVVLTYADRVFVSGPYLGIRGVALSTLAAILGWYIARVASRLGQSTNASGRPGRYSLGPEMMFTVFAVIIFLALAYAKLFDLTKVDYTATDVFYHLLLIVLAAFVIRMAAKSIKAMTA
jgi:hypothetical protein